MKWFKQKHSVCMECGAHFEPVTGYEARWGDLCGHHRRPVMERDEKRDAVVAWAGRNWERLSKTMEAEAEAERESHKKALQGIINPSAERRMLQALNAYPYYNRQCQGG